MCSVVASKEIFDFDQRTVRTLTGIWTGHCAIVSMADKSSISAEANMMWRKRNRCNTFYASFPHFRANVIGFSLTERLKDHATKGTGLFNLKLGVVHIHY